jgi:hypothetical protein
MTSSASPESILDRIELEKALAYIRQKKEGLLQGRREVGGKTSSA